MRLVGATSGGDVGISAIDANPIPRSRLPLKLRDDRLVEVCSHLVRHSIQPAIIQSAARTSLEDVASDVHGPFFAVDDKAETALILPTDYHEQMMLTRHSGVES